MKHRMTALLLALLLTLTPLPVRAAEPEAAGLDVTAPAAVLMERATGTLLFEKNAHEALPPASVTKVMTLLLVLEALDEGRIGWDDTVTASEAAAAKGGSQIYLEPGEGLPLREMLKSVAVASANDCACALAEHVAGSEAAFVDRMNRRAAELGMADTHFVNCTGLDDGPDADTHRTSAHDIALMSRALLAHDEIRDYTTIWMDSVRDGRFGLANTNKLIRFYPGATGLKTGYTSRAGYCLSASAERGGVEYIAVVLDCASSADRFSDAKVLLDYGFANYALVTPEAETATVPVRLGMVPEAEAVLQDAGPLLLPKGDAARAEQEAELTEAVEAPVEAGQRLGTLRIRSGEAVVAELPLVAAAPVPRLTFWESAKRVLRAAVGASV